MARDEHPPIEIQTGDVWVAKKTGEKVQVLEVLPGSPHGFNVVFKRIDDSSQAVTSVSNWRRFYRCETKYDHAACETCRYRLGTSIDLDIKEPPLGAGAQLRAYLEAVLRVAEFSTLEEQLQVMAEARAYLVKLDEVSRALSVAVMGEELTKKAYKHADALRLEVEARKTTSLTCHQCNAPMLNPDKCDQCGAEYSSVE